MSEFHDPFIPHQVDESIERLLSNDQDDLPTMQRKRNANARLIHDLRKHYHPEHARYLQALQRVEDRLLEQLAPQHEDQPTTDVPPLLQRQASSWWKRQQREKYMQEKQFPISRGTRIGRYVSIVILFLLLSGSITLVLTYGRQITSGASSQPTKPTPKPRLQATPIPELPIGTTLYTTPTNASGFNGVSWSPDNKRIASTSVDGVQIQDALNGQNLIHVRLAGSGEWPYTVDWSPKSQAVAIGTNQEVLIVDGRNGQVLHSYTGNLTALAKPAFPVTSSYLGDHFSDSGGFGFRAVAWSPDGKLLASALSSGAAGVLQIWNPETNAKQFTLQVSQNYNIGSLSWSSDGQYIAATTWNTQPPTDPTQPSGTVVVWKVSTQQVVFQHNDMMNSDAPIVWQPQSHHIAFSGQVSSHFSIEVWDVITGSLVKQYTNGENNGLAWSPDGKYFAYWGYIQKSDMVIIVDANTDKQIFLYKEHKYNVSIITWSPNSKYIASVEGNSSGTALMKIWMAE